MQYKSFKLFIKKVVIEGNDLQKKNVDGKLTTTKRFTTMQIIALVLAIVAIFFLDEGFTENFAGFVIGFLGIFIGLFASIVISTFDKRQSLFDTGEIISDVEKETLKKVKNYFIQFTGLTSYSILLAIAVIILLSLVLLHSIFRTDIFTFYLVDSISDINLKSIFIFFKVLFLILHRFLIVYFLVNFFTITIYSITSYFSFLQSEYKKMKL